MTQPTSSPFMFLYPIYRWGIIAPYLALSTAVFATVIMVFCIFGSPNFASRVFGRAWARSNMFVSRMKVNIVGRENLDPNQSYVVVANHQSLVDIYVIYGYLDVDIKWVMKKELRSVPFLGIACEMMGHIIIDRSNTEAALTSINDARDRIRNGVSVVFFPEGTRSRSGELQGFKKGAFRLAQELQLPILPITLHDTDHVLPSDTTSIVPGSVTLEYNTPIPTAGLEPADVDQLVRDCYTVLARSLGYPAEKETA